MSEEEKLKLFTEGEEKERRKKVDELLWKKMEEENIEAWLKFGVGLGWAEGLEKQKDAIREYWPDVVTVAGRWDIDKRKKGKTKLYHYTDLDTKGALFLRRLAGFPERNIIYVPPGESLPGTENIDVGEPGGRAGFEIEIEEKKDEFGRKQKIVTAYSDHHYKSLARPRFSSFSATEDVYKTLVAESFLERTETLDRLVKFINYTDNQSLPNQKKYFETSGQHLYGLSRFLDVERLYNFLEKHSQEPLEELIVKPLSDEELIELKLMPKDKNDKTPDRVKEQRELIERTKKLIPEMAKEGFAVETKLGKILIDCQKDVRAGQAGTRFFGYDGFLIYDKEYESCFLALNNLEKGGLDQLNLDKKFPQLKIVRGVMGIKPRDNQLLEISLRDLLKELGVKEKEIKGELKKTVEKNDRLMEMRKNIFEVKPRWFKDPKDPTGKKGHWGSSYLSNEYGKHGIFPEDFKPEEDFLYQVKIKKDTRPDKEKEGAYILKVVGEKKKEKIEQKRQKEQIPEKKEAGQETYVVGVKYSQGRWVAWLPGDKKVGILENQNFEKEGGYDARFLYKVNVKKELPNCYILETIRKTEQHVPEPAP